MYLYICIPVRVKDGCICISVYLLELKMVVFVYICIPVRVKDDCICISVYLLELKMVECESNSSTLS